MISEYLWAKRGIDGEFLNVKQYWPDIQMFKLQTNYRSKPHIVAAGNEVIKKNTKQYEKNIVAHREGNDKITIFTHPSDTDEAANTIEMIKQLKEKGKIRSRRTDRDFV